MRGPAADAYDATLWIRTLQVSGSEPIGSGHCGCLVERMNTKENNFSGNLRRKLAKWAVSKGVIGPLVECVLALPDLFVFMSRMIVDPRVLAVDKAVLACVIGYVVAPFDLIPEAVLGPAGYIDDVALACLALDGILRRLGGRYVETRPGGNNVIETVGRVLNRAAEVLGAQLWEKTANYLKRR